VAHEAVTNVEHHAHARNVRVRWECDGRFGRLTVADDGKGFDAAAVAREGSFGLQGMRERADAIGARLDIGSEPFVGTVVECQVNE
jgi:signal transduction histidine kinase